ncbi:hypothetical protein OAJ27_00200 [bacterium]|nr:hypothetical protein [bacterium]
MVSTSVVALTQLNPKELKLNKNITITDQYPSGGIPGKDTSLETVNLDPLGRISQEHLEGWLKGQGAIEFPDQYWDRNLGFIEIIGTGESDLDVYVQEWIPQGSLINRIRANTDMVKILTDVKKSGGVDQDPKLSNLIATSNSSNKVFTQINENHPSHRYANYKKSIQTVLKIQDRQKQGGGLFFHVKEDKSSNVMGAYEKSDAAGVPQKALPLYIQLGSDSLTAAVKDAAPWSSLFGNVPGQRSNDKLSYKAISFVGLDAAEELNNGANSGSFYTKKTSGNAQITIIQRPIGADNACVIMSSARELNKLLMHGNPSSPSTPPTEPTISNLCPSSTTHPRLVLYKVKLEGTGSIIGKIGDSWGSKGSRVSVVRENNGTGTMSSETVAVGEADLSSETNHNNSNLSTPTLQYTEENTGPTPTVWRLIGSFNLKKGYEGVDNTSQMWTGLTVGKKLFIQTNVNVKHTATSLRNFVVFLTTFRCVGGGPVKGPQDKYITSNYAFFDIEGNGPPFSPAAYLPLFIVHQFTDPNFVTACRAKPRLELWFTYQNVLQSGGNSKVTIKYNNSLQLFP